MQIEACKICPFKVCAGKRENSCNYSYIVLIEKNSLFGSLDCRISLFIRTAVLNSVIFLPRIYRFFCFSLLAFFRLFSFFWFHSCWCRFTLVPFSISHVCFFVGCHSTEPPVFAKVHRILRVWLVHVQHSPTKSWKILACLFWPTILEPIFGQRFDKNLWEVWLDAHWH